MKLHQSLIVFFSIFMLLFADPTFAATEGQGDNGQNGLVEVDIPQNTLAPYRERRAGHTWYFGIDYENMIFKNFVSANDSMSWNSIFGSSSIPFIHASLDWKYNFSGGGIAIGLDAGGGSQSGASSHSLDITKYGLGLKYVIDTIWPEPYVAPYIGVNAWQLMFRDNAGTASVNKTVGIGYNYTIGLLIQLNWLEDGNSKESTFNWGIENTYLNVYGTQYTTVSSAFDSSTDFLWGAGLKFEF